MRRPSHLPELHECGIDPRALIGLTQIAQIKGSPGYSALRSYATGRRTNRQLGAMPYARARIGHRRLWLRTEIEAWLHPFTRLQVHRGRS